MYHPITFYHFDGYIITFFMIWAWEVIFELGNTSLQKHKSFKWNYFILYYFVFASHP